MGAQEAVRSGPESDLVQTSAFSDPKSGEAEWRETDELEGREAVY